MQHIVVLPLTQIKLIWTRNDIFGLKYKSPFGFLSPVILYHLDFWDEIKSKVHLSFNKVFFSRANHADKPFLICNETKKCPIYVAFIINHIPVVLFEFRWFFSKIGIPYTYRIWSTLYWTFIIVYESMSNAVQLYPNWRMNKVPFKSKKLKSTCIIRPNTEVLGIQNAIVCGCKGHFNQNESLPNGWSISILLTCFSILRIHILLMCTTCSIVITSMIKRRSW